MDCSFERTTRLRLEDEALENERESLLTKFLPGVDHSGRGIIGREVFQILLPRPGCHSRKLFRSTIKIANVQLVLSMKYTYILKYLWAAFSALITFAKMKSANVFPLEKAAA